MSCLGPRFWIFTVPETFANSVWSVPTPTFAPARTGVPRWRIRIFPARTDWPPNGFTPSRLEWESRPFRVLPPAFLCAMSANPAKKVLYASACADVRDLDLGERLPVGLLPQVVLTAAELHDAHLGALAVADHGGEDLSTLQKGLAQGHIGPLAYQQHFVELDRCARLRIEPFGPQDT